MALPRATTLNDVSGYTQIGGRVKMKEGVSDGDGGAKIIENGTRGWWYILYKASRRGLSMKRTCSTWTKDRLQCVYQNVFSGSSHSLWNLEKKFRGRTLPPTTRPFRTERRCKQKDNDGGNNLSLIKTPQRNDAANSEYGKHLIGEGKFSLIYVDSYGRAVKTYKKGAENYAIREKDILKHVGSSVHPNILKYLGWSLNGLGQHELYMEHCVIDLADQLQRMGSLPERVVKHLTAQLVSALRYLHAVGVFHRDIKPENILLDIQGNPKIADFGLSSRREGVSPQNCLLTQCGSPPYAAPEVFLHSGMEYGSACDWWSLGVVVFEMLAGNLPWLPPISINDIQELYTGSLGIEMPSYTSLECKIFLSDLICKDPSTRLGSIGTWELKHHICFKRCPAIDWKGLKAGRVPSPLVPLHHSKVRTNRF